MKNFTVQYLLPAASMWLVVIVKAGNKEQARSIVKRMTNCVATRVEET